MLFDAVSRETAKQAVALEVSNVRFSYSVILKHQSLCKCIQLMKMKHENLNVSVTHRHSDLHIYEKLNDVAWNFVISYTSVGGLDARYSLCRLLLSLWRFI